MSHSTETVAPALSGEPRFACGGFPDIPRRSRFTGPMTTSSEQLKDAITDAVLAGIVTISADAIICVDAAQQIIFFNEGAESIFGYRVEEIIGQPLEVLIPERYRPTHAAHVKRFGHSEVRARRMGERGQILGRRKNGEEFPAEAASSHLGDEPNKIYSVVLRDITEFGDWPA